MDAEKPGLILRLLMKVDPGVFYWVVQLLKGAAAVADLLVLGPLFGRSFSHGPRDEQRMSRAVPSRRGAQLVQVLFRGTYSLLTNHTLDNFFYRHVAYVDPEYILEHDNVTLHGMTDRHAFFCVSDPAFDVYEMSSAPFLWIIQFFRAEKLVIVSHDVFNE